MEAKPFPDRPFETSSPACSEAPASPSPDCEMPDHLLALARQYLRSDLRRPAMGILWSLLESHLPTPQSRAARSELRQLAQRYEAEGFTHIASDICERLLCSEELTQTSR